MCHQVSRGQPGSLGFVNRRDQRVFVLFLETKNQLEDEVLHRPYVHINHPTPTTAYHKWSESTLYTARVNT